MRFDRYSRHRRDRRPGVAALEFALVLPVLITLLLGCVDFGRFPYYQLAVINAAEAGAVYGSTHSYTSTTAAAWQTQVQQAVQNEMQNLSGFDLTQLTITITRGTDSSGATNVSVEVRYPFRSLIAWPVLSSSLTLRQVSIARSVR